MWCSLGCSSQIFLQCNKVLVNNKKKLAPQHPLVRATQQADVPQQAELPQQAEFRGKTHPNHRVSTLANYQCSTAEESWRYTDQFKQFVTTLVSAESQPPPSSPHTRVITPPHGPTVLVPRPNQSRLRVPGWPQGHVSKASRPLEAACQPPNPGIWQCLVPLTFDLL